jgi:hypothetical protein
MHSTCCVDLNRLVHCTRVFRSPPHHRVIFHFVLGQYQIRIQVFRHREHTSIAHDSFGRVSADSGCLCSTSCVRPLCLRSPSTPAHHGCPIVYRQFCGSCRVWRHFRGGESSCCHPTWGTFWSWRDGTDACLRNDVTIRVHACQWDERWIASGRAQQTSQGRLKPHVAHFHRHSGLCEHDSRVRIAHLDPTPRNVYARYA